MEFVTVHDLSRELDVSARVIRYHLTRLITAGKLEKDKDFRQENFKDPLHFEWRINPVSFMRESGLKPKTPPNVVNAMDNDSVTTGNNPVNGPLTKASPPATESRSVTPPLQPVNEPVNQTDTIISLHREMIDTLKDQVKRKDEQIGQQSEQIRELSKLNVNLNGALLQQGSEIKKLLRLTGGKMEMADAVNHDRNSVNNAGNEKPPAVNRSVNESGDHVNQSETAMAA